MKYLILFLKKLFLYSLLVILVLIIFSLGRYSVLLYPLSSVSYLERAVLPLPIPSPQVIPVVPVPQTAEAPIAQEITWGGPELWEAINQRRVENGVNPLKQKEELCTIASIRLNEILDLGKLDAHEGFSTLPERREDLKWIFNKYNIYEFLISGAESPEEAVDRWENTLGHKLLVTGGELVWGCVYASEGFGVAIAAF